MQFAQEPQKFKPLYVSKVSSTKVFKNRFPDFGKKAKTLKKQFQLERDELQKTATARAQKQIEYQFSSIMADRSIRRYCFSREQ